VGVRDIVGHMIDVTEAISIAGHKAKKGEQADVTPLTSMADMLNKGAQSFRKYPREEVIARWKRASDKMLSTFREPGRRRLEQVHGDPGYGPAATFFYPAFHVMDYGVHTWDIATGSARKRAGSTSAHAGVLIPYNAVRADANTVADSAKKENLTYGLSISAKWGRQLS